MSILSSPLHEEFFFFKDDKNKKTNVHKYVRQKCANCNISSRSYPTLPHKKWFHFNIHAFIIHTELLKLPDNADLDNKQTNKQWEKTVFDFMPGQNKPFPAVWWKPWLYQFDQWGGTGSWVKSIKHSTYTLFFITLTTKKGRKTKEKGIPLFLALRRGYVRQEGRAGLGSP